MRNRLNLMLYTYIISMHYAYPVHAFILCIFQVFIQSPVIWVYNSPFSSFVQSSAFQACIRSIYILGLNIMLYFKVMIILSHKSFAFQKIWFKNYQSPYFSMKK